MGRSAKYTNSDFIRAGLQMAAEGGPASVTMAGLSSRAGAPLGSVYHRFQSRRVLMGELWLGLVESFQHGFLAELSGGDMTSTALYTLRWARARPLEARVLMLHRRQDFTGPGWPAGMRTRAGSLAGELNQGLEDFAFRHFGREDS
ncbi:MAG: TetR/AcrR family transcriptional regulator; helix-turn-helix transcriptional regulator, partial [Proteobacteria bacterium]|nr:TetR/AcrR family transcriptional regulator; helix-turn-helix transcriptional regulator [Pseudomonadota bacterium]